MVAITEKHYLPNKTKYSKTHIIKNVCGRLAPLPNRDEASTVDNERIYEFVMRRVVRVGPCKKNNEPSVYLASSIFRLVIYFVTNHIMFLSTALGYFDFFMHYIALSGRNVTKLMATLSNLCKNKNHTLVLLKEHLRL